MSDVALDGAKWPPEFSLDQERILNLLTGDRFYSNPSAALREAVLNSIDAVQRRRRLEPGLVPKIDVSFDRDDLTLTVADNGVGMSQSDVRDLFAKVGASAADAEARKESVGEFGIGVVSYFMAGDSFLLQTFDGASEPIGLEFSRGMLAGGSAHELPAERKERGTTLTIRVRDRQVFDLLVHEYPHWCRDVEGLAGVVAPESKPLSQGGSHRTADVVDVPSTEWVEKSYLGPVANPTGWNAMTGNSEVSILYRGVFVQKFSINGCWGIEGSIDVDPKHFKPRLNREGFVGNQFQGDVEKYLRECHPAILKAMAGRLADAVSRGELDKWDQKRWATLWLAVPRKDEYRDALTAWDAIFRALPAFEFADGNSWKAVSLDVLARVEGEIYVAPLQEDKADDVIWAAVRLLRNTGRNVIRGVRKDKSWMRFSGASFATTADLITSVFAAELPPLKPIAPIAQQLLSEVAAIARVFSGPPSIEVVRLGRESPPALRLHDRLVLNVDHPSGAAIVADVLEANSGPASLIGIVAIRSYEHLTQVAAAVREIGAPREILSPIRRRYIRGKIS